MTRTTCIAVLIFSVAGSEAFAQSFQDSVRREAARAAAQPSQSQATNNPIAPGYLWTGIGLMTGGAVYVAIATALKDPCDSVSSSYSCTSDASSVKAGVAVFGAALIGTGAALLVIGNHKRNIASPELVTVRRGVAIRTRFTF